MTGIPIGKILQTTEISAECAKCPWTFKTTIPGKAAHKLMDHNQEEHS